MDWTGGTRRRYAGKGKGNATVQKQKAHFAKARAATGYQVIPETFLQSAAALRKVKPRVTPAQGAIEHFRSSEPREPSRVSRGGDGHHMPTHHNIDREGRRTKHMKQKTGTSADPEAAVSGEEMALIANRKRLLARGDWLRLAATRPVMIKFPSEREQERIGKRRKIDRPKARKDSSAEMRAVRNPFEKIHEPFEPLMGGAIGHDNIRIKIGTDAFLSQTQQSRRSHNSANTSIRPLSTDNEPISEESMLVEADSDGFEARQANHSNDGTPHTGLESEYGNDESPCTVQHMQRLPDRDRYRQNVIADPHAENESMAELDTMAGVPNLPLRAFSSNLDPTSPQLGVPRSAYLSMAQSECDTLSTQDEEKNERIWRDFMQVRQTVPSNVSVAVLRSSSPHLTQSTASVWPAIRAIDTELDDEMLDNQENLGFPDVRESSTVHSPVHITHSNIFSIAISSPSPSHRQIHQLANQAPMPKTTKDEEDGQDELWRQFVVGSSQSQSSHGGGPRMQPDFSEELLPAQLSFTQSSSQGGINTSLAGHATTAGADRDADLETTELALRRRRKTANKHANEPSMVPKRHYERRSRTHYAPVPRALPRVLNKANTLAQPRSIYDLSTNSA